jgi:acyl-ACP thioesterase
MKTVETLDFEVRTYECDPRDRLKPPVLLNYLQEAADQSARNLGFGVEQLHPQRLTWFLSRYRIVMTRLPTLREKVRVQTWPCASRPMRAQRDFEIVDGEGGHLGHATTSWMMISLADRKIVEPTLVVNPAYLAEGCVLENPFGTIDAAAPELVRLERTRYHDLDRNRHVNNGVYLSFTMGHGPKDLLKSYQPLDMELVYLAEIKADEELRNLCAVKELPDGRVETLHLLTDAAGTTECFRQRTLWSKV